MKRADKRIRYHDHALTRMSQRGVSSDQVAQTLRKPDTERPAKNQNAKRFEKTFSKTKRLSVIAEEKPAEFWVISAFWS
jgi:hypothetical protein